MLLKKHEQHKIARTSDTMLDTAALSDIRAQLSVREIAITDQMFCVRVLDSLPREYEYEVRHFQSALTPATLDRIEQIVREQFVSIQSEKLKKKQSPGHALYAGDTASSGRGGRGLGGNSGRGRGGRGRGNANSNWVGLNTLGGRASGVQTASANDGSTAVTKTGGDMSKEYCTLCHKHGYSMSRPGLCHL